MLKAAVDVGYKQSRAKAVCVLFKHWHDEAPSGTHVAFQEGVAAYEPGAFYKRELPCLLNVLQQVNLSLLEVLIVDGYVYLDDEGRWGLGAYLYEAMGKSLPVIGVAKTKFSSNTRQAVPIRRGESRNPLFVSAIGMNLMEAAGYIKSMAGASRIPALLHYLDRKTKMEW